MFKKSVFVLSIFLLTILSLIGCNTNNVNNGNQVENKDIRVKVATLNGPTAMSMVKMLEEKPALGEGVGVDYIIKDSPDPIKTMLIQSEVDIATIPTNLAAILYNKNQEYQAAAISHWGTLYLVGTGTNIKGWEELKGKEIYLMAKGLTPDISFRYLLDQQGIDPENDLILNYKFPMPADLGSAVAAGKTEYAVLSEPMVSMVLAKNKDVKVLMNLTEEWNIITENKIPLAQTTVFVKKSFAQQHPEILDAFLAEFNNSINWVNENQNTAGELIEKHKILPNKKIASAAIPRCNMKYEDAYKIKDGITDYLKIFYDYDPKIVGGKLPDENFYYKR